MKDNSYAFIIDCSLDKKDNIIIYELQPLIDSDLGNKKGAQRNAFQKAFPNKSISIEYFGVNIKNNNNGIFVKKCKDVKDEEFNQEYAYKFTPSRYESSQLGSKINQRLYLPHEVSPKHLVLDLLLDSDELTNRVIQYFKDKNIERIVLKHPDLAVGKGNTFIDDLTNKESIKDGIESLRKMHGIRSGFPNYLLAEEQKIFPRISRKTEEKKDGYLTFRVVGIATKEGGLGYSIATKSLSEEMNSHKRKRMKRYFGEEHESIDCDNANNKWKSTYVGPKDKYFNIGERKILIEESVMQKVFKAAYHLYHDIKSHSKIEFQEHIAKCVKAHNNKENYSPFMDHEFEKLELVEKNDLAALLLINEAHYLPLRNKVKNKINYELVNLRDGYNKYIECGGRIDSIVSSSSHIGNFYCGGTMICEYSSDFILKDLLYVIEIQNAFDILELLVTNHNLKIEVLLSTAAKKEYLNIVKYLTENKNTDRNFKVDGALILAVEERHLETVKYLVENKDINQNLKIDLALILAAERGYLDVVRYLVENKDINQNLEIDSALIVAAERGRLDIVKYLIEEHGYKPKDINQLIDETVYSVYSNINVMRYLIDERKCIQLDEYPYTKLLSKRTLYSFDKTKYFIQEKGYDINDQNKDGNTVLHNAVNRFNHDGNEYISIIKFLVNCPGVDLNRKNNAGQTPLECSNYFHVKPIQEIILDAQRKNSTPNSALDNLEGKTPTFIENIAEENTNLRVLKEP